MFHEINQLTCALGDFWCFPKHAFSMSGSNTDVEENPVHGCRSSPRFLVFPCAQAWDLVDVTLKNTEWNSKSIVKTYTNMLFYYSLNADSQKHMDTCRFCISSDVKVQQDCVFNSFICKIMILSQIFPDAPTFTNTWSRWIRVSFHAGAPWDSASGSLRAYNACVPFDWCESIYLHHVGFHTAFFPPGAHCGRHRLCRINKVASKRPLGLQFSLNMIQHDTVLSPICQRTSW